MDHPVISPKVSRDQFREWAAEDFFLSYRADRIAALHNARQKAQSLSGDDRKVLALTFANVATGAREMGGLFGGGKLPVWLIAGVASIAMSEYSFGMWSAVPLVLSFLLALWDLRRCLSRAEAYSAIASLLNGGS